MDRRCLTVANGGEVSPDLYGRFDVPKVANGYKTIMNFIVTIQGTAYFRGGFKYLAKTKDRAKKSYLDDFTYTEQDAYILEWGDKYVRFYRNGDPVMKNGAKTFGTTRIFPTIRTVSFRWKTGIWRLH